MQYSNMRDFIQGIMNGMSDDGRLQVDVVSGAANVELSDADVQQIANAIAAGLANLDIDISDADTTEIATKIAAQQLTALGYGWDYSAATPVWRKLSVDSSGDLQIDIKTLPAITGSVNADISTADINELAAAVAASYLSTYGYGWDYTLGTPIWRKISVTPDGSQVITGSIAHDAVDSGNPLKIGGKANAALPAAVGEADRVAASFDLFGEQRVLIPFAPSNIVPNSTQADQALTVDGTAGGVQFSALHADTTHVVLDVQTNDVRVTFDNSAPTATNGHLIPFGSTMVWSKALAAASKWIRVTGSATVHLSQLKA